MILGLSIYIRISGLDRNPDVSSGFANGKVLLVGSACKSICKCKSSFQTDQSFFRSNKILEQSKMLMECTCGTSMDFYPHAFASSWCTFRDHRTNQCNDTYFCGILMVVCSLGDGKSWDYSKHLPFYSMSSDLEHILLLLCSLDALVCLARWFPLVYNGWDPISCIASLLSTCPSGKTMSPESRP